MCGLTTPTGNTTLQAKIVKYNNNQNVGAYTLLTANGMDCIFRLNDIFSDVASGGLVSMSLTTDDGTPLTLLTAVEGGVAGLVASTHLAFAQKGIWFVLKNGKKLIHNINGTNGNAGSGMIAVEFYGSLA